ncbi:MAG: Holliday junction resolvase RuvX [Rickettsiales bacterium]|jgi:putative Holliday junction resolvase|nr:Holliday junction resolvase RuvX [Rickettsiales bacterium]
MILTNFKDFPKNGRLLGIDWGAKRTGLAVCDQEWNFVFPREHIITKGQMDKRTNGHQSSGMSICPSVLLSIICDERIVGIVIGLPIRSDGSDSDTTRSVRAFAASLAAQTDLPIIFIDETLTSAEAEERQKSNGKKKKESLDSVAAAVILENAIACIKRENNE